MPFFGHMYQEILLVLSLKYTNSMATSVMPIAAFLVEATIVSRLDYITP